MFVLLITMSTTLQPECLNISGKGDGNENDEDCDEDDELCEGVSFFYWEQWTDTQGLKVSKALLVDFALRCILV